MPHLIMTVGMYLFHECHVGEHSSTLVICNAGIHMFNVLMC